MSTTEQLTEKDDNEELVIVETAAEDPAGEDPRPRASDPDDDTEDPNVSEAVRERRRREKQERKLRRSEAVKRDKTELDFLRKRNEELERRLVAQEQRSVQMDLNALDTEINTAVKSAETAERVIAKAVEAGNGEDVAQAMRYRDQAMERARQLAAAKQAALQRPAPAMPVIDDATLRHAQDFIAENSWYDPQGRDEDSAVVLAIDQALVKDGYNPQSSEYWDELRRRAARRLPERFDSAASSAERRPRGGPAVGSGREHVPPSTRREVYISPERKQALIEAGVWDDPVLRARYVKRYAEYDRNNRA